MSTSENDTFAVGVDGDTTLSVVKFLRGRGFGALMTKEALCMLPADLTDECVASTAAAAAEFEVLAVLRIDAGDICLRNLNIASKATGSRSPTSTTIQTGRMATI